MKEDQKKITIFNKKNATSREVVDKKKNQEIFSLLVFFCPNFQDHILL